MDESKFSPEGLNKHSSNSTNVVHQEQGDVILLGIHNLASQRHHHLSL
jgi:hypothetical protein